MNRLLLLILLLAASTTYAQGQSVYQHMTTAKRRNDSIAASYGQYAAPKKNTSLNDKLDDNNGFRDYHFGQAFVMHASELKLIFQDSESKIYERKNENLKAGYATLTSINYIFVDDKLSTIIIKLTGQANSDLMKLALLEQYGYTEPKDYAPNQYSWRGQKVNLTFKAATLDSPNAQVMYVGFK